MLIAVPSDAIERLVRLVLLTLLCLLAQMWWGFRLMLAGSFGLFLYTEATRRAFIPSITPFYLFSISVLWTRELVSICFPAYEISVWVHTVAFLATTIPVFTTRVASGRELACLAFIYAGLMYFGLYDTALALLPLQFGFRKSSVARANTIACAAWAVWLACPFGIPLTWTAQLGTNTLNLVALYTGLACQTGVAWYI